MQAPNPVAGDTAARRARRILDKLNGFLRRTMPARGRRLILALVFSSLAAGASAQGYSRAAEQVLARAFAATGGSGWYLLRGWRETGREGGVAYERWVDPLRYGLRVETREAGGLRIHGFNGQADWQVLPDGTITAVNDHATLAQARTQAFFAADCFFFPGRFDARGEFLGVRRLKGRAYDVVEIRPWGGEPRELWFDQHSRLLARIVERSGRRASAVTVSDYRKVGPVRVAFRYTPEPGAAADARPRELESLAFTPADRDLFSLNRPEALAKVQRAATPGR